MGRLKCPWTFLLWFLSVPFLVLATYYEAPLAKRHVALGATDLPCGSEIVVNADEKYLFDSRSAILYESSQYSKEGKESSHGSRRRRDTSKTSPIKMKIIPNSASEQEQSSKSNSQNRMQMPMKNQPGMSQNKPRLNNQKVNRNQPMTPDKPVNQNQFPLRNQQKPQNQNKAVPHGQMPVRKQQLAQNYTLPNKQMPLVNNSQSYNQPHQNQSQPENYAKQQPQGRGNDHSHKSDYSHGGSGSYGHHGSHGKGYGHHHSGGGSSSYTGAASHHNEYIEPITCQWTYIASPDCSLEAYVVRFKPGDLNCDKQQFVIDDGHTEFKMCGYETLHPSFRAETPKLIIKYWRQPYTYRHVFKGYVTCEGRPNRPKYDDKEYSSGGKNTENVEADNQAQTQIEESQPQQSSAVEQEVVAEQTEVLQTDAALEEINAKVEEAAVESIGLEFVDLAGLNSGSVVVHVGVHGGAALDTEANVLEAGLEEQTKILESSAVKHAQTMGQIEQFMSELEANTDQSTSKIEETSQFFHEVQNVEDTKMSLAESDLMLQEAAQSNTLEEERTLIEKAEQVLEFVHAQIVDAEAKEQQKMADQNEEIQIVEVDETQVDDTEQAQTSGNQVETHEQEMGEQFEFKTLDGHVVILKFGGGRSADDVVNDAIDLEEEGRVAEEAVDGTVEEAPQFELTGVVQEFDDLDAPGAVVAEGESAINQETETENEDVVLHETPVESLHYRPTYTPTPTYTYNPYNPYLQTPSSVTYHNPHPASAHGRAEDETKADAKDVVAGRSHEEQEERTPYYGGPTQYAPNYQQGPYAGGPGPSTYPLKAIPGTVSITYPYTGSSAQQPIQGGGGASGGGYRYLVPSLANPNIKYLITCQLPQPYPCTPIHVSGAYAQQGPHTKRAVATMPVVYG